MLTVELEGSISVIDYILKMNFLLNSNYFCQFRNKHNDWDMFDIIICGIIKNRIMMRWILMLVFLGLCCGMVPYHKLNEE